MFKPAYDPFQSFTNDIPVYFAIKYMIWIKCDVNKFSACHLSF